MTAPKKIWVPEVWCKDLVWMRDPAIKEIPYIRADLVDDLVEALEDVLSYTAEINPNQGFDGQDQPAVNLARAALARVKDE